MCVLETVYIQYIHIEIKNLSGNQSVRIYVSKGVWDFLGRSLGDTSLMRLHWPEFTVGMFLSA